MMSMMKLLPLLFIFAGFVFMDQLTCPDQSVIGEYCARNSCNGTAKCTMIVPKEYHCCEWTISLCNETGLIAFSNIQGYKVWFEWTSNNENHMWYGKIIRTNNKNIQIACPVPTPFFFTNSTTTIIAVGFEGEGSIARKCNDNTDCNIKEFCAPAYNPSYCNDTESDQQFHNNCIDKSNNGTAMTFCFPDPTFSDATWSPMKAEFGLLECQDNTTCQDGFCDTSRPIQKMKDGELTTYNGICVVVVELVEVKEDRETTTRKEVDFEAKRRRMREIVKNLPSADDTYFTSDRISVLILIAFSWLIIFAFCCICFLKQED